MLPQRGATQVTPKCRKDNAAICLSVCVCVCVSVAHTSVCVCAITKINDQARAGNAGRAQPDERKKSSERESEGKGYTEREGAKEEKAKGARDTGPTKGNKNIINYHIKYTANPLYRPAFPC